MRKWYPAILVALAFALSFAAYGRLPDPMPIHWNIHGKVDDYGSRVLGTLLMPVIMLAIALLIPVLPRIDPRGKSYGKFMPTYLTIMGAVLTLLLVIHIVTLGSALGWNLPVGRLIPAAIGVLFIVMGNLLPRIRPNWMVGIRTPWTLSSDRVWERTHRVGGYLMLGAGVLLLVAAPFASAVASFALIMGGATVAALGAVIYSYVAWRQEKRA